jgi:Mg-chelatase subunit ChlI
MLTEVLVWALILRQKPKEVIEIYATEQMCRRDAMEARRTVPEVEVECVQRYSMEHPRE